MPFRTKGLGGRTVDILCEEPATPSEFSTLDSPSLERRIMDFSFGPSENTSTPYPESTKRRMSMETMMRARFDSYSSSSSSSYASSGSGISTSTGYSSAATSLTGSPTNFECGLSSGSWGSYSVDQKRTLSTSSLRSTYSDAMPGIETSRPMMAEHRSRSMCAIPQKRTSTDPLPRAESVRQKTFDGYIESPSSYEGARSHRGSVDGGLPGIKDLLNVPGQTYPDGPRVVAPQSSDIRDSAFAPLPIREGFSQTRPNFLSVRHNSLPTLPPPPRSAITSFKEPSYYPPVDNRLTPPMISPSPTDGRPRGVSVSSEFMDEKSQASARYSSISRTPSPEENSRKKSVTKDSEPSSSAASSTSAKPAKRKFPCTVCGKNFTTSGHLSRHGRTHTGEKNYECPFKDCGSRFSRQDNCMQHYRTHLTDESRRRKKKTASTTPSTSSTSLKGTSPSPSPALDFKDTDALATLATVAIAVRGELEVNGRD